MERECHSMHGHSFIWQVEKLSASIDIEQVSFQLMKLIEVTELERTINSGNILFLPVIQLHG